MTEVLRIFGQNTYARLFQQGDLFLPISERWRNRLLECGAPEHRTLVHRMGIDVENFSAIERPLERASCVRLLSVGRLVEKKGFADAIAALAKLPRQFNVQYEIVGSGPLRDQLQRDIMLHRLTDRVRLLGTLDHEAVRQKMQDADLLLAPSVTASNGDQEGIPVTLMEAMAMELPVLSTQHSGIPELVAHDRSGFLVPERNPERLAEQLERLIVDPALRRNFGRAGREIIINDYNIERLNDLLLQRFRTLISE